MRTIVSPRAHQVIVASRVNTIGSLAGITLGLFCNSKPNAALLLDAIAERLDERFGLADIIRMSKPSPAEAASEYVYDTMASRCDAVLFATADCGSCTAWGMHDVAEFERRGLPAVLLTGHPFVPLAESYAKSVGYKQRLVVFEHPIAGQAEPLVREKADKLVDDVIDAFVNRVAAAAA